MRRSKFGNEPVKDKNGRLKHVMPVNGDLDIYKALARPYCPLSRSSELAALLGRDKSSMDERLRNLKAAPNNFVRVCYHQTENKQAHLSSSLFYQLDKKGRERCAEEGIEATDFRTDQFTHAVMWCMCANSLDIATVQNPSLDIIWWEEIKTNKGFKSDFSAAVPVNDRTRRSDGVPFVLSRINHPMQYVFSNGIEIDTGSEPIKSSNKHRATIEEKFADYITIIKEDLFSDHFSTPTSFVVPFVTTTEARMFSMMELLADMTNNREVLSRVLFKFIPVKSTGYEKACPATGHIYTTPWKRAGMPDFNLATDWEVFW